MTQRTETFLDQIVSDKRDELAAAKAAVPLSELRSRLADAPSPRPFIAALAGTKISLIAEVKKASPSKGLLRADFDPIDIANRYATSGAAAISVLTDAKHFQGSLEHLESIREALPGGPPLLRKDFIFDEYQIYEARAHGADALLLIVAMLEQPLLDALLARTQELGMTALVEVHDESEMERAASSGAELIGVNNRDLRTFDVDLATSERLAPLAPPGATIVAESGISTRDDIRRLEGAGVDAVLIGEALVTSSDPGEKIKELFG
ncbi:MAG: indole-3-glycerol phosphate synthase TrpC [Dehalococcoidia bacterium]